MEQDPKDMLSTYLNILFPFVTCDMMTASIENANEYLLKKRDANMYKLFVSLPPFLTVSIHKK
ncbi:DUF3212 family protein [Bacillus sp. NPDC077027]|uniref:DUF3212 family protein n=1 Tax=Bacillus sp. NPDC077027 TaxID=3390548 RepID=UPI003D0192D3